MKCIAAIPARYASTRFPGKLLYEVEGKTILQRTYENIVRSKLFDQIIIATDDQKIAEHVKLYCANIIMTSPDLLNGTERICEAIKKCSDVDRNDIIVNVQGDEPYLPRSTLQAVIESLQKNPNDYLVTAYVKINDQDLIHMPSIVKCVFDNNGYALYFSRSPIPYIRNSSFTHIYKHIGIYGFRAYFLSKYSELISTPLQKTEDLEQLKILEHGYKIRLVETHEETFDINVPEDIIRLQKKLAST